MDKTLPTVVIGFLGTQLDAGLGAGRWEKWRPTVALAQQPDMQVARLELLHTPQHEGLARQLVQDIGRVSPGTEVRLIAIDIADPWDFGEMYGALYDWVKRYPFAPERERYWAHITTGTHVAQICLFLLVESRFIPGVLLQTAPPKKQVAGDPGRYSLIDLDLSRYDALARRLHEEQSDALAFLKSGIATRNTRFNALIEEIERVAVRSKAPILLTGPTGAGKSHLARRMFELKKSRHQVSGEFVEVNCATLHGDGAASTLFGHKKGAFTGAAADRAGLLRAAHEGVLFLDEIGELGLDEQAMLLKAVEEKRFFPMGSDREVSSDFQLIAGTNRDLRRDVAAGRFREDLYARINLWSYTLPGLAQRPEDLEPNIEHLLAKAVAENGRVVRFNAEAKAAYLRFASSPEARWSGNFRDLSARVTRLATRADGAAPGPPRRGGAPPPAPGGPGGRGGPRPPTAGESPPAWSTPRSSGCAGSGTAATAKGRRPPLSAATPPTSIRCSAPKPPPRSTCSTGCSCRPCCACAPRPATCRTRAGDFSTSPAPSAAW